MSSSQKTHLIPNPVIAVLNTYPYSSFLIDPKTFQIYFANKEAIKEFGYTEEAFHHLSFPGLLAAQSVPSFLQTIAGADEEPSQFTYTFCKKNGTQQAISVQISLLQIENRQFCQALLLEKTGVVEEKGNSFSEMANTAPVMIWMCDENGIVSFLNHRWIEFTGVDISEQDSSSWSKLLHEDDVLTAEKQYNTAWEQRKPITLIYRLRSKDGSFKWVKDTSTPRLVNGRFVGYLGILVEIEDQKRTEEQLRYQATILENVSDIVFTTDLDFKVKVWNKVAEHYYGISEEEAKGQRIGELIQFTFHGTTVDHAMKDLTKHEKWEGEVSLTNKNGETRFFLHTVKHAYDDQGKKIGYLAVSRDISEKKEIEQQLVKSEQFYRALIADSLDGTILVQADGLITFGSPSVKNILGYETTEIECRNVFEFVHPDDIDWAKESFQKEVVENPEIKFITVRLKKKNGHWLWCMVRGHNLLKNPYLKSMVVYFHDDTMRKQAKDALKESEKRFRSLVKDLQIGVLLQDSTGNIILSNNVMTRIFDINEEGLIGKKIWQVFSDVIHENGDTFLLDERPIYKAVHTKKPVYDMVMGVWQPQKKERIWLMVSADPVLDDNGTLLHVVCSFTNITERKKLEQKFITEKLNHQKQLTQATIDGQEAERREIGKELHDNIGQQLTTIKLLLDVVKTTANNDSVEMINTAVKSVLDVINEIRSMSRSLVPHTLKDLGLIDSISELIQAIHTTNTVSIHFEYEDFEEESLPDNQKLSLFRIIQEQFNNISKHAEAKNVSIVLKNTIQSVVLEIKDDGRGFDIKKVRKGHGIANIYNRAELFGGKAIIQSRPGKGCSLKVSIPVLFPQSPVLTNSYN